MKLTRRTECRTANTRFAKSGNNCFDLKFFVKFAVYASGENFTLKSRLRQAVETLAVIVKTKIKLLCTK